MSILIKNYIDAHPRIKQWGWFIILWFGGLLTAMCLAYPIKFLIKTIL